LGPRRGIEPAGGSIAVPKTDIGSGFGLFAHFVDSEGNKVGLHSMR
jgi:predicted enzyme related to lactoylglutathione lyase